MNTKLLKIILWTSIIILGATVWFDLLYSLNIFMASDWGIAKNAEFVNKGIFISVFVFSIGYLVGLLFLLQENSAQYNTQLSTKLDFNKLNPITNPELEIEKLTNTSEIPVVNNFNTSPYKNEDTNISPTTDTTTVMDDSFSMNNNDIQNTNGMFDIPDTPVLSTDSIDNSHEKQTSNIINMDSKPDISTMSLSDNEMPMVVGSDISPNSIVNSLSVNNQKSENQTVQSFDNTFDLNAPIDFSSFDDIEPAPVEEISNNNTNDLEFQNFALPESFDDSTMQNKSLDASSFLASDYTIENINKYATEANIKIKDVPEISNCKLSFWGLGGQTLYIGLVFSNSGKFKVLDNDSNIKWESDNGLIVKSPVEVLKNLVTNISNLSKEALEDDIGIQIKPFVYLENAEITDVISARKFWQSIDIDVLSDNQPELISLETYFKNNTVTESTDEAFESFIDALADCIKG